ncbi:hypothetical protein [Neorhodopirellula lusitana]|uniref:hypothetical protein n=1 Tax=Neorhodopirellula lusitana TaxID=445327 RepID=UPI00384A9E97
MLTTKGFVISIRSTTTANGDPIDAKPIFLPVIRLEEPGREIGRVRLLASLLGCCHNWSIADGFGWIQWNVSATRYQWCGARSCEANIWSLGLALVTIEIYATDG